MAGRLTSISFMQRTDRLVAELEALAPTILATYPSAAVLLAEEREAGLFDFQLIQSGPAELNLQTPLRCPHGGAGRSPLQGLGGAGGGGGMLSSGLA